MVNVFKEITELFSLLRRERDKLFISIAVIALIIICIAAVGLGYGLINVPENSSFKFWQPWLIALFTILLNISTSALAASFIEILLRIREEIKERKLRGNFKSFWGSNFEEGTV